MNSMVDFFLSWWLRSGRYRWSTLRRRLCEQQYLKTPLPKASSLEEIESCLKQIKWHMEGLWHLYDSISYPQTTWFKKKDDCDGFATLAAELLYRLNPDYNPILLTTIVRPIKRSHTVCVFDNLQGGLWYFDNSRLKQDNCETYNEISLKISHRGQRLVCWDVCHHSTFKLLEFHRL